jgi:hypothetical protein
MTVRYRYQVLTAFFATTVFVALEMDISSDEMKTPPPPFKRCTKGVPTKF